MPAVDVRGARIEYHDQGAGEPVILLHSSAGSSAQWRALAGMLAGRYRVLAPDLFGCGDSPMRPGGPFGLAHEAEIARALLQRAGGAAHLVGHSYGGAVALHTALRHGASVLSLALIEPVAFHLLRENEAFDALALAEIAAVAARVTRACIDGSMARGRGR